MWPFTVSLNVFYGLMMVSALAAGILFACFQQGRQNLLLRSCCVLLLGTYFTILVGHHLHKGHPESPVFKFCSPQAIILAYMFVAIHAHVCFLMFYYCYTGLSWRFSPFTNPWTREWLLLIFSYALPLIPTIYALVQRDALKIFPQAFFCFMTGKVFETVTLWFILFAVPGVFFSLTLLYKTWKARQRLKSLRAKSQFTRTYLLRLSLSTFIYVLLAGGSIFPLCIFNLPTITEEDKVQVSDSNWFINQRSPWSNPQLCIAVPAEPNLRPYHRLLCPGLLSFAPAMIGICIFLMYGFGTQARRCYKSFWEAIVKQRRPPPILPTEAPNESAIDEHPDIPASPEILPPNSMD